MAARFLRSARKRASRRRRNGLRLVMGPRAPPWAAQFWGVGSAGGAAAGRTVGTPVLGAGQRAGDFFYHQPGAGGRTRFRRVANSADGDSRVGGRGAADLSESDGGRAGCDGWNWS